MNDATGNPVSKLLRLIAQILIPGMFCLHLATVFLISPGYMSIDEGTYHLMSHNFAEHLDLGIRNGYEEFPSDSLEIKTWTAAPIKVAEGRLVPQYPYLYPVVTLPFYKLFGYRALFLVQALFFWIGLVVTWKLALRITGKPAAAWTASVVLGLGGFYLEYSLATMPHLLMVVLVTAAFHQMIVAYQDDTRLHALASGLLFGLSLGIRYDAILMAPVLVAPFLFAWQVRWARVFDLVLGSLPGLLLLLWTNYLKFGFLALLSYGRPTLPERYIPIMIVAVLGGVGLWLVTRRKPLTLLWEQRRRGWIFLPLLLLGLLIPEVRRPVFKGAEGVYLIAVNLTSAALNDKEQRLSLVTERQAITYVGGIKKALLQSCPYLACLVLPLLIGFRRPEKRLYTALLFGPILGFIAFFSYFKWHGGLCLNMRYLLPIFPFAAVLTAEVLVNLANHTRFMVAGLCAGAAFYIVALFSVDPHLVNLWLPLVLAGLTVLACGFVFFADVGARLLAVVLAMGLAWSSMTTMFYDMPLMAKRRERNWVFASAVGPKVEPDSMLFVDTFDPYFPLMERNILLARPEMNGYEDFEDLASFHLGQGRPVYLAFTYRSLGQVKSKGLLDGFNEKTLAQFGQVNLIRLTKAPE